MDNYTILVDNKTKEKDFKSFILCILDNESNNINYKKYDDLDNDIEDSSYTILNDILTKIKKVCMQNNGEMTIAIEHGYIDRVYRDSYYMYFSNKHFNYNRFCKRLFIFCGNHEEDILRGNNSSSLSDDFLGSIVIKPIKPGSIGRTFLNPKYFLHNCYLRLSIFSMSVFGLRLEVESFPYSMQDSETITCAETTILNILEYYSNTYSDYKYLLPSDIMAISEKFDYERYLPTNGLIHKMISKVLKEVGFYPRIYDVTENIHKSLIKNILHYYIESGIPVAVGYIKPEGRHMVLCIGHYKGNNNKIDSEITRINNDNNVIFICDTADLVQKYIMMDDTKSPYILQDVIENGMYSIVVPLYKRMFLDAKDAYRICTSVISDNKLGIKNLFNLLNKKNTKNNINTPKCITENKNIGTEDNPIIFRMFLASSKTFKSNRLEKLTTENNIIRSHYLEVAFPRFVWVCEISNVFLYNNSKILGEIIIDATSALGDELNSIIMINYPFRIASRKPNENLTTLIYEYMYAGSEKWSPFNCFDGNLQNINESFL